MAWQGKMVEYIEHGKFLCGFVLEDNSKRLRLLNQNGREVSLPPARVVHQSGASHPSQASREELLKQLKAVAERRQAIMAAVNLQEIWELASDEAETVFAPRFLTELCFGAESTDDHEAAFLRCVFKDRLYFKYKDGRIHAHSPEVVEQLRARQEKERQKEALLSTGAKLLALMAKGTEPTEWPEREACIRLVREYYLFGNDAPDSDVARDLLKRAQLNRPHDVFHLLVRAGIWDKNENIPRHRSEIPVDFSEAALKETEVAEPDPETLIAAGRRDLRDLPLLTIDGEATRDYDDALHIEKRDGNYLIGVHVSDVAEYVKPGSALFEEAVGRVTSIYFPEERLPMLPPVLSEGACSLIAGRPRAVMSFMVLLSPEAEVLDYDIVPGVVTVKRQLNYTEAEELLDTDPELRDLVMLSRKLQKQRVENGALLLPIPDVNIDICPDGSVSVSLADSATRARTLVAEFMVLANSLAARYVADRQAPGLYRCQEPPFQRLVVGVQKDLFANFRQRKQLKPGQLLTVPQPHSGVGTTQYTTVTSPIRRLLDLVMQHQIFSLTQGKGALFSDRQLSGLAAAISAAQTRVNLVRRLRHRYWLLKYLEAKLGSRVDALILEKGPKRANVVLLDCLLDGDLPANQAVAAKPGDIVQVKIAKVSPLDNTLRLEW